MLNAALTAVPKQTNRTLGIMSRYLLATITVPCADFQGQLRRPDQPYTKPRVLLGKLPMLGKMVASCAALTPNHWARVDAY